MLLGFLALTPGCLETADPTTPCASMDVSEPAGPARLSPATAPIVAMSGQDAASTVVLYPSCTDGTCALRQSPLHPNDDPTRVLTPGSAVLVTSSGNFVVAIDRQSPGKFHTWTVEHGELVARDDLGSNPAIVRLVAGMRGSDWILTRDRDQELYLIHPGTSAAPRKIAGAETYVVAVGERFVITRRIVSGSESIVEVIDTQPVRPAQPLLRASNLTRVSIAPGDAAVAITVGNGEETLVYDPQTRDLTDRFQGSLASGREDLDDVPGLNAFSPDGTRLTYRTHSGALAIRDVQSAGSCLVRSASEGYHEISGFSADGILYMESHEDGHASADRSRVLAFDPTTRRLSALGEAADDFHLAAVPAVANPWVGPWAVGVSDGVHHGLAEGDNNTPLGLDSAAFLARDATQVWAVESMPAHDASGADRTLTVRTIEPTPGADGSIEFATAGPLAHPHHFDPEPDGALTDMGPFQHDLDGSARVCLSTGMPGGWAYRCGHATENSLLRAPGAPSSEDPGKDQPEPEIPKLPEPEDDDDGA